MHKAVTGALWAVCLTLLGTSIALARTPPVEARLNGLQDFVLEFAQPMQNWDNAVRRDLVRLTPALPATCTWDSDTRLACHLDGRFALATRYRLDIAPGLKTQAGTVLAEQTLHVETARPSVSAHIEDWKNGRPELQVSADMPVEPADLRTVLRLELDGRPITPRLQPLPPQWQGDTRSRFRLAVPSDADRSLLTLRVKPGLRTASGPLPGQQDAELLRARINEPFFLRGVVCAGMGDRVIAPVRDSIVTVQCVPDQPVQLVFSRLLDTASRDMVAQRVVEAGAKVFRIERSISWNRKDSPFNEENVQAMPAQWAGIGEFAAGSRIELSFDGAMASEDGAVLTPAMVRISFGEAQPQLRARNRALVADGQHPPALVHAVNVGSATLNVRGLGTQAQSETVQAHSPRRGSVPEPVASRVSAKALADGGWVRWSPVDKAATRSWNAGESVEFAAPAFDLLALSGQREVLAWANEWDRDAPVAGAQIELLWLDPGSTQPRVVASGRTGEDGTVLLRLPADLVVPEPDYDDYGRPQTEKPMWLLRAARTQVDANQRAVLPMDDVGDSSLGRATARGTWGVSDRPLYHAGDTVHYKLWQRELDGVHLRAVDDGPVSLQLQNAEDDKVILEWQATRAKDGSIAGDLALPVHLTDATYCIGVKNRYNTDGSCFFVGTYRAQDLWLETTSRGGVVRDGERFVADAKAGYFSGGPAASAEVTRAAVSLEPEPLETAYPQFADFTFIEVDGDDTEYVELAGLDAYEALDEHGAVRIDVPVAFEGTATEIAKRPAFGLLTTELEVSPEDREGTSAYEQTTRYARYPRYVGLRTLPDWFDADDPVSLEAVVITAQGKEITSAEVEVTIEYLAGYSLDLPGERVARCVVRTRQPTPCAFARERTGYYRLTARSGDAAPAELQRYVWWHGHALRADAPEPDLSVIDAAPQRDRPARVLVKQPFARARALFAITFGGAILGHRVETIEGNAQEVSLPLARDWRGMLEVKALVRETAATKVEAGLRQPARLEWLDADIPLAPPSPPEALVSVDFRTAQAKPGSRARITLRNNSTKPRQVALSVMDDALRAQAQRWLPYADPVGPTSFRESMLFRGGRGSVGYTAFDEWTADDWRWLLPWAKQTEVAGNAAERRSVEREAYAPRAAPAPGYGYGEATVLDRVEVTGSRIRRVDIAESNEAKAPDPALRLDRTKAANPGSPMSAVRTRFADTALWLPDIQLAPGESREIDVPLPDNLTRWRAVAWSADAGDDFAMAEAALEVGLPVEARLQAPVRLYPGDISRVATSVRHIAATPAVAQTTLEVKGEGANAAESQQDAQSIRLAARGQSSVATTLHPQATGVLQLVAAAHTAAGSDAVAGTIEIASPLIAARKLQAGWVGEDTLKLDLPALPEAVTAPSLRVSLLRGGAGLTSQWTQDLHDYPHRCWEQILSRAMGAALAVERRDPNWPDAAAVVNEALANAAVFQLDSGGFVYFPGMGSYHPDASVTLTAYTVRAFALLRSLGHPVSERIEADAREFLSRIKAPAQPREGSDEEFARFAYATAEQAPERVADLDPLWSHWDRLPLPVQVASARAFARADHPSAARATRRLLARAPVRGSARSLRLPQRYDAWMSSDLREQCAVIELLRDHPKLGDRLARRQLLTGMNDLYAGGVAAVDTQTAASCLMALRDTAGQSASPAQVRFVIGTRERSLELVQGQAKADWDVGTPDGAQLQVAGARENAVPVSYVAQLDYLEDARTAQPSAVGLAIERRYDVLRDGAWKPVAGQMLHEGDWIRITLDVRTTAEREFVAVTDAVPGGLQPTDLELSGVGTADLKRIASEGSGYFGTRKLDARSSRFYAERLPAGSHELHYFARVGNSGDYLAAPATAELMYGSATYARTAATRLSISEAASGRAQARAD